MKIAKQLYGDICFGDLDEEDGYKVIEGGEWIDDGKYSHKEVIFSFEDKFYSIGYSRSGSFHTDYFYDWEYEDGPFNCCEVEKKTVTVEKWVGVDVKS